MLTRNRVMMIIICRGSVLHICRSGLQYVVRGVTSEDQTQCAEDVDEKECEPIAICGSDLHI